MEVKAQKIELVSPATLIPHPRNNNKHTPEQIDRLCKLIQYTGFRDPIEVQEGTNIIVAGHGRLEAAKKLGMEKVPVVYMPFKDDEEKYAYMTANNAIARWAEIDLSMVNAELENLGPDLDIDMLGVKDFTIEPLEKYEGRNSEIDVDSFGNDLKHECPKCGFEFND